MGTGGKSALAMILLISLLASFLTVIVAVPENASAYSPHDPIIIDGNGDFTAVNGVIGGSGTSEDPYVIEGWDINDILSGIHIKNTTSHFLVRNIKVQTSSHYGIYGIYLENVTNGRFQNNEISNSSGGIVSKLSSNIHIDNCTISHNAIGIIIYLSSNSTITHNTIQGNIATGIFFDESINSTISGNTISDNEHGITMYYSRNCIIRNNAIIENGFFGIKLTASTNIHIYHNEFIENTIQAWENVIGNNFWNDSLFEGGNYWSDYEGIDSDGDGIGDTPYNFTGNQDNYPLMEPYSAVTGRGLADTFLLVGIIAVIFIVVALLFFFMRPKKGSPEVSSILPEKSPQ